MSLELIINYHPYETRVALLENGTLVEFQVERGAQGIGLLGNIYMGKVIRVLPGMQAAFVDIGLEKAAFLYVDDVYDPQKTIDNILEHSGSDEHSCSLEHFNLSRYNDSPPIESLLSESQEIMVQVSKEPIGQKGARVTSHISLPSWRLVLMTMDCHLGISRRIEDEEERKRLKDILEKIQPNDKNFGFIARTAAEGATEYEIKAEATFLSSLWQTILRKSQNVSAPAIIHKELDATLKAVRDIFTEEVSRLVIDDVGQFNAVKNFLEIFSPQLANSLELYQDKKPIFYAFDIETDIARALDKKVWLKSGGYIVIESTEALTVIDVNTGKYVGHHSPEETIVKTNLEAVREIAYQLRLRNIGGIIIIDFIDMEKDLNRERVYLALKDALKKDKGKTKIMPMSELGLIEMTRKRTRENIDRLLREPCFYCQGQAFLLSKTSVWHKAFVDLEQSACDYPNKDLVLTVHPFIKETILDEGRFALEYLEKKLNCSITIKSDSNLHLEAYTIDVKHFKG